MKRVITALTLCLFVTTLPAFSSAPIPAIETEAIKITTEALEGTSFRLLIINLQQETTAIKIESLDEAVTYFQEYVKDHNGYAKRIDLQKVPEGKYLLKVIHANKEMVKVIRKEGGQLYISKTAR